MPPPRPTALVPSRQRSGPAARTPKCAHLFPAMQSTTHAVTHRFRSGTGRWDGPLVRRRRYRGPVRGLPGLAERSHPRTIEIRRRGAWATGAVLVRALRSGNAPRRLVRRCRRSPRGSGPPPASPTFPPCRPVPWQGIKMGMATLVSKCDMLSNYLICPDASATQSLRVRSAQSSITVPFRQSLLHRTILPAAA